MECEEIRIDTREFTPEDYAENRRQTELLFRLAHTLPTGEEYKQLLKELFGDNLGEGSYIAAPLSGASLEKLKIGRNVYINNNFLAMASGGIIIEDDVKIAAYASVISNNHDPYERPVLTCKPVLIKKGAWIGAHAVILPGVCVGRYAIAAAGAVVHKDVPDYSIVAGNPARLVKTLDAAKFAGDYSTDSVS